VTELYAKADVERAVREATSGAFSVGYGIKPEGYDDTRRDVLPDITSRILASLTPVRLPVLTSCGGCTSMGGHRHGNWCLLVTDRGGFVPVKSLDAPPDWCPLRRPR